MSTFPNALRPAARSAYRSVLRSARITFQGDQPRKTALLTAVRQTFESPTLTAPSPTPTPTPTPSSSASGSTSQNPQTTEDDLQQRIEEWREVALFLRKNVVQGVQDEEGTFHLRVTPETELGDNLTVREPPKLPTTPFPNRGKRRPIQTCGGATTAA